MYTANVIESLNATYRKLNCQISVFPIYTALLKALYMATFEDTEKWTSTIWDTGGGFTANRVLHMKDGTSNK
ncbi:hypothetical protein DW877_15520 [[Clostridium] symbiosum]|nr:hypothetical protein DW877_15520 [[Clostridium] symbiosum]